MVIFKFFDKLLFESERYPKEISSEMSHCTYPVRKPCSHLQVDISANIALLTCLRELNCTHMMITAICWTICLSGLSESLDG